MKRKLTAALIVSSLLCANTLAAMLGDLDGSGDITAKDASIALMMASGTEAQDLTGDVNGDNTVNSKDASLILQYVSGSISSFPAETASEATTSSYVEGTTEATTEAVTETTTAITYETNIVLADGASYSDNGGVEIDNTNNIITIVNGGTYTFSGSLSNGQIVLNSSVDTVIELNGVNITNLTGPAIYGIDGDMDISAKKGSVNYLADGTSYTDLNEDGEPDACVFSQDRISFKGKGTLYITGNYGDAVGGKDEVKVKNLNLNITAKDDGIRGKDYIQITSGTLNITSTGAAVKSTQGYVTVNEEDGTSTLTLNAQGKGIKAETELNLAAGTYNITSTDDAIHSNTNVTIDGGTYTISSGDDGIHADAALNINGGDINITKSYEGLEATDLTVNGGNISLKASDDGLNAAGGNDSSGTSGNDTQDPWTPTSPGSGFGGSTSTGTLVINGGTLFVNSEGDGLDSNGNLTVNGGEIVVAGPTSGGNGYFDIGDNGCTFLYNGGTLVGYGTSDMLVSPSTSSNLYSLVYGGNFSSGTTLTLADASGNIVGSVKTQKQGGAVTFCLEGITAGNTLTLYSGGTISGCEYDSLGYGSGGTITGGTSLGSATISQKVTTIGTSSQGGPGQGNRPF